MKQIYSAVSNFFYYGFAVVFGLPGVLMAWPFKRFQTSFKSELPNTLKDSYMGIGLIFWLIMAFVYDGLSR